VENRWSALHVFILRKSAAAGESPLPFKTDIKFLLIVTPYSKLQFQRSDIVKGGGFLEGNKQTILQIRNFSRSIARGFPSCYRRLRGQARSMKRSLHEQSLEIANHVDCLLRQLISSPGTRYVNAQSARYRAASRSAFARQFRFTSIKSARADLVLACELTPMSIPGYQRFIECFSSPRERRNNSAMHRERLAEMRKETLPAIKKKSRSGNRLFSFRF